jgi:thioredoxin-like negative regulator of GroEL
VSKENSPLGQAWRAHAVGRNDSAVEEFQKIASASPEDVDALYGLALSQRGAGLKAEALANFKRLLELVESASSEDDDQKARQQMLTRMVSQQIKILEEG